MKIAAICLTTAITVLLADGTAGIQWTVPANWKPEAPRPMRAATYSVGDAECGVYYFGPGQGGSVQQNLDRWIGQFEEPGGRPSKEVARGKTETINGLKVTTVDVSGTYTGAGGPMASEKSSKPDYRLLGAIVETSQGPVFFKFTGPAKAIAAHQTEFVHILKSLRRAS
jgi:hypothetical protein